MNLKDTPQIESAPGLDILNEILPVVRKNCLIADAQHSGLYSLCGLFLRLKDQFNWEQGRPPWSPTQEDHLLKCIDWKESQWLSLLERPYEPIILDGRPFDCLDSQSVNRRLLPLGYYYGAGYGRGLKPTFFLGAVKEKYQFQGFSVIILERELALDLSLTPALRQGRSIIIRQEALRFFLWSKIQETEQWEREATQMALAFYGWDSARPPEKQLDPILQAEARTILFHELGEALDRTFPQGLWKKLLLTFPFSRVELYLRTLKDLLADTHPRGTLGHIIQERKTGSLAFYLSNLKGLRRPLFPEIISAIQQFKEDRDWSLIRQAGKEGRRRMIFQARRIIALADRCLPDRPEEFAKHFDREFYKPIGL
jgi:hypothetical protein